jgi:homoserine dehydrogenase
MIKVGMLGFGTVGSGFYEILKKSQARLQKKYSDSVEVCGVMVRSVDKYADLAKEVLVTDSLEKLLESKPDIVIEATGGVDGPYEMAVKVISSGIHYVTANKDLIAEKGKELRKLAEDNKVRLLYEASVAGGIPVLKPIRECLTGNTISSLAGIINGTSNYILSCMYDDGSDFADVLKTAQDLGYAEADPTSDVDGLDAGRKLAIMSSLAYGVDVDWKNIKIEGIRGVSSSDIEFAKSIGYKVKLLAVSLDTENGVYAAVTPCFVNSTSYFGITDNVFNAVMIDADAVGTLVFTGRGAGALPTGSSVYSDLEDVLETVVFGKSRDNELHIGGDAKAVLNEYPISSEWIVSYDESLDSLLTDQLINSFEDVGLVMKKNPSWKKVYFKTGHISELALKDRIRKIAGEQAGKVKIYQVYE